MIRRILHCTLSLGLHSTCPFVSIGAALTVQVGTPVTPRADMFHMGTDHRPDGTTLTLDGRSLRLNGEPWTPVMGEFHYSRYPAGEWREELLKIKAGGVDVVATYVFWIHHEEIEGQWDWSGRRDLRRFVQLCGDVGLKAIVRCGPWCHGEVRNGGHPDWLLEKGWKLRSNDSNYLAQVTILYGQIAKQLTGLLWKDGGPVIGIQLENECRGPASYLLALKRIAREAGLDVPLYTRTGWPALSSPLPFGEIIPLYGVYAEGFWDRELTSMPGRYWAGFHFSTLRTDANIANEVLGRGQLRDDDDVARYPYLTCEIGAGMMTSYHRRILVDPADAEAVTLVKLGSGSVSPGYYMYHGGVNPEGKRTTLNESQANGEWNDLPVKSYDFQTALGEYGQIRPQYHELRRLHLFLHDFGAMLATMPPAMPDHRPDGPNDVETLRWCVRSDGTAGFLFVNNYERGRELPARGDVQFAVNLPSGPLIFPKEPVTVASRIRFIWPFNLDLGNGVQLAWASAQPLCAIDEMNVRTVFFAETPGIPAVFAFTRTNVSLSDCKGTVTGADGLALVSEIQPGEGPFVRVHSRPGTNGSAVQVVLLDEPGSLALWKQTWLGRERVFLTGAGLVVDGKSLRLTGASPDGLSVGIYPPPGEVQADGHVLRPRPEGVFGRFQVFEPQPAAGNPSVELLRKAGPARIVPLGKSRRPVAAQPADADFDQAAVWRITLPDDVDPESDVLLRLDYVGDVARVQLNGKLLTDDFYNGRPFEIGLRRYVPDIFSGDLQVMILPLRRDAPIFLAGQARPDFGDRESVVELRQVKLVSRCRTELTGAP